MSPSRCHGLRTLLVFLAVCACAPAAIVKEKPDWMKTCYIKNPKEFPDCSRASVQAIFDKLSTGFPEAGILPLDPLLIDEIRILEGGNGPVSVNATLRNAKITGFGKVQILSNVVDNKTYSFTTHMKVPDVRIEGHYTLKGRILLIPLSGHGNAWFEPHNMDVTTRHDVQLHKKKGLHFFNITNVHVNFKLGGLKLRMENLYNGQKALEESTNAYINNNWRALSESLKPVLTTTIEDILIVILRKLFDNTPAQFYIDDIEKLK